MTSLLRGACWAVLSLVACATESVRAEELPIRAATAYIEPNYSGIRGGRDGLGPWNDATQTISWFGEIKQPGELRAFVAVRLEAGETATLTLCIGDQTHEAIAERMDSDFFRVDFGTFDIAEPGYVRIELSRTEDDVPRSLRIRGLVLDGPAVEGAHFNRDPRRNAASVHLMYPTPKEAEIDRFYCEVTGVDDPLWTFYMACGFHRGYFGMQVNSPDERRIIFSVWDSGGEAVDRDKVADENRVRLVAKGEDVDAGDFGNEGTGGHSHLVYPWKTGEPQRFLLAAQPSSETRTTFAGWWFHPEKKEWTLIASFDAPKDGGHLRGLHSFSENFVGDNGHLRRKALYGSQWIRTTDGQWTELTTAKFSHDPTGKANRLDRFMGVEDAQFFLSHGGFAPGSTSYGERFERPATGKPPAELKALPEMPKP